MALQISDTTPRIQYTATSGQTSFSVPFEFFAVADLKVYNGTTLLTYNNSPSSASQYSVTGAGVTGGGSITLGSPGATLNDSITIVRDLAIERLSDFPVSGNFPIQTLNSELDKIVAMLQQLEEQFARTLQYPVTTTTGFDVDLPELVANRVLSVNADATALLAEQELGTFKGDWAASTSYQVRDLVKDTSNGNIYFVNAAHTSSGSEPLSSNTNSSKYDLIVDAESATTSATNAATSATAAASSASAAATSATNAATSETNAATSESNASTSETNASTSATNASNSATAAATSATNAATSESNASTSETNAATSATNAASSATSAASSATTATTQASAASTSATNAATSETNAATSASNASTSETNAATSATNASNAQTAAETAQAAAEAAADSIDDTYLGAKASNPTVDNDGDPLTVGDWYFNTTSNQTFIYNGSSWDAIAPDLIGDATPQLGGDLDLNSNDITGTGNINIAGNITATQISIGDSHIILDDVNDNLEINSSTDEDIKINSARNVGNDLDHTSAGGTRSFQITSQGESKTHLFLNTGGDFSLYEDTGATAKLFWDASAERLGIGTDSPQRPLHVVDGNSQAFIRIQDTANNADTNAHTGGFEIYGADGNRSALFRFESSLNRDLNFGNETSTGSLIFETNASEAMRIDSSGNVLVGKTSGGSANVGVQFEQIGRGGFTVDGAYTAFFNRKTSDGDILDLRKDGTTIGTIGVNSSDNLYFAGGSGGTKGIYFSGSNMSPANTGGATLDNGVDIGSSGARWKDLYLSGNIYLGGTGSANALDDYEEGSWTPTLGGTTTNPTTSYNHQVGRYTKIGRTVTIDFYVQLNPSGNSGGTGALTINGFPFDVGSLGTHGKSGLCMYTGNFSTVGNGAPVGFFANQNSTFAYFRSPASSYPSSSFHTSTQASDVTNSVIVAGTLTYQIT